MEYQQTGKHAITEELTLEDFKWEILFVMHSFAEPRTVVTVSLNTDNVRDIEIESPAQITEQKLNTQLMKLDAFKGSTPV